MQNENQGCLTVLLKLLGIDIARDVAAHETPPSRLPFRLRDHFLSPAELSFFHVLQGVVRQRCYIATKVRISDLLYVVQRRNNMQHANRIDRKHVDFVLCDPNTMQPRLIIELDDSSHARKDRSDRDAIVDAAFAAAGMRVLHVVARRAYSPNEIEQLIGNALLNTTATAPLPSPQLTGHSGRSSNRKDSASITPMCPKCHIPMVQRKAARGSHKGKRFWACPGFPECRQIMPIE